MLPETNPLDKFLTGKHVWPDENEKPPELSHFTGCVAAQSICRDRVLCFNSRKMEDQNEFQLGRMFMMLHPCKKVKEYSWEELCADAEKDVRCWTFSLCNVDNEKTKQEMIRKHCCGKPGGPAVLSFSFVELQQKVNAIMTEDMGNLQAPKNQRCFHFFLPCLYAKKDHGVILKLLKYLFGEYYEELKETYTDKIDRRELAFACSYIFRAMVKADQYQNEHEYRLVKITFDGNDDKSLPFGIDCHPRSIPLPFSCPFCANR